MAGEVAIESYKAELKTQLFAGRQKQVVGGCLTDNRRRQQLPPHWRI